MHGLFNFRCRAEPIIFLQGHPLFSIYLVEQEFCWSKSGRTLNKVKEQNGRNKQTNNASYVYGPVFKIISQSNLGESHRNTTNLTSIMLSSDFHFIVQETNGGKWCGVTVYTKGNFLKQNFWSLHPVFRTLTQPLNNLVRLFNTQGTLL